MVAGFDYSSEELPGQDRYGPKDGNTCLHVLMKAYTHRQAHKERQDQDNRSYCVTIYVLHSMSCLILIKLINCLVLRFYDI